MSFADNLENKVKDLLEGNYEREDLEYVPNINNVSTKKKYVNTCLCAMFIDLRNSSDLLINKWKQTSAKVHKAYLQGVVDVVKENGGKIRSFQGDGVLSFWPAYKKSQISDAVKCAMNLKWALRAKCKKYFDEYLDIDFGIGINWDDAFVIRAGDTDKPDNNDLVFITKAVNKAVRLSDIGKVPYNIGITESVYSNLLEDKIYHTKEDGQKVNMWEENHFTWAGTREKFYKTTYHWGMS